MSDQQRPHALRAFRLQHTYCQEHGQRQYYCGACLVEFEKTGVMPPALEVCATNLDPDGRRGTITFRVPYTKAERDAIMAEAAARVAARETEP